MTIRITRNAAGNCITFIGSSMPAYFNACLSGQVDPTNPDLVNVVNDIQTANDPNGQFRYEFYQIPFTQFADRDGNSFATGQEAADYITAEGNVLGVSDVGRDLNGTTVNFRLDQTNTSIIMDNGSAFGVNTIKAVADTDGTIHIHAIGAGVPEDSNEPDDHKHFQGLDPLQTQINGIQVPGGLNDVVNALNEFFTVGPFEAITIADPYSTMVADVNGVPALYTLEGSTAINPVGSDIFGNASTGNYAGLKSTATIDQAGEYFTFDIREEGQIGFGLVHSDASYAAGKYQGNASYADPSSFAVGNSAHYGYQFSHWFHPTPNGSWTNYGASTGMVMGPGWSNWDQKQDWLDGNPVKIKVGLDINGFISIESLQNDGSWKVHARSSYPVPEGAEFHLGIKAAYPQPRVFSAPMVHLLEPAAPTLYFRYIESPDGYYSYPLFLTQEEADYYEEQVSGSPNGSHTHVYPDDPSSTTWYMPNTAHQMNYGLTPIEDGVTTFMGNTINWTEITSLTNADLVPPTFSGSLTVNEGATMNYQTQPQDTTYTTTFSGLVPALIDGGGGMIFGTAPDVSGDTTTNPSDEYVITVTRTNSYGSSSGTFTLTVLNTTAPVTPISGFSVPAGSPAWDDEDTLSAGAVAEVDDTLNVGNRFIIDQDFVNNYVKPAIGAGLTGTRRVFVGFAASSPDWSNGVGPVDFELCLEFFVDGANRAADNWRLRVHNQGTQVHNVGIGGLSSTNGLYDYALINTGTELKVGAVVSSQGYDMATLSYSAGSPWNWTSEVTGLTAADRKVYIGTEGAQLDLDLSVFSEVSELVASAANVLVSEVSETEARFDTGSGPQTADTVTLTAGATTSFYLTNASVESGDTLTFETLDGTSYTTGVSTVGSFGDWDYRVEFVVPSDVPPLRAVWNGADQETLQISGSTYTVPVTGVAIEGPTANFTGNVINANSNGWISLNETLSAGERLVLDSAFIEDVNNALPDYCVFWVGLKRTGWTNTDFPTSSFFGTTALRFYKTNQAGVSILGYANGGLSNQSYSASLSNSSAFLEITSTGNNIRVGYAHSTTYDADTTAYADWDGNLKIQTGDQGYGISSLDVVLYWQALNSNTVGFDITDVDWTGLSEISNPTPAVTLTTPWTKALDFSGAAERVQQVSTAYNYNPVMAGLGVTVPQSSTLGWTSDDSNSRPWATAIVFKPDGNSSNQHIWNVGEGAGSTDDNIYLRVDSVGNLFFGWGRQGAVNECVIGSGFHNGPGTSQFWGVYIAHTGERLSGANATPTNLARCFDIRILNNQGGTWGIHGAGNTFADSTGNRSTVTNWSRSGSSTGGRMDRTVLGATTIGGRGANRNFHGKVASMVITTLRQHQPMPAEAEIVMMVRDPEQWMLDYKRYQPYRAPWQAGDLQTWNLNSSTPAYATQVWLMGDGTSDAYAQIRNQVYPAIQNIYPLNMISMVSNDIETVNIPGLS